MKHLTNSKYWKAYHALPPQAKKIADKNLQLLKSNMRYPSLHFKKIDKLYSVRIGLDYRALGADSKDKTGIIWFWIGGHDEYNKLIL